MSVIICFGCLSGAVLAEPVSSNVQAIQRGDGSGRLDAYYNLDGAGGSPLVTQSFMLDEETTVSGTSTTIMLPGNVPLEVVSIPLGSYLMGGDEKDSHWTDSNECPAHTVNISRGFQMGKYEMTQRQWLAVMDKWPDKVYYPGGANSFYTNYGVGDDYPAYWVSWNDIMTSGGFMEKLNQHIAATGQGAPRFRLPSEAEWEYACRAGSATRFSFGDSDCIFCDCDICNVGDYAWYCGNNTQYGAKPVGKKLPNAFGLNDMHGNVWEWCLDNSHPTYNGAPTDGSAWNDPAIANRVLRGGHWDGYPKNCRSSVRCNLAPATRGPYFGFRVIRQD